MNALAFKNFQIELNGINFTLLNSNTQKSGLVLHNIPNDIDPIIFTNSCREVLNLYNWLNEFEFIFSSEFVHMNFESLYPYYEIFNYNKKLKELIKEASKKPLPKEIYQDILYCTKPFLIEFERLLPILKQREENYNKKQEKKEKYKNEEGFIYLIKSNNMYKIGKTKNIKTRIQSIKTSTPFLLEIVHTQKYINYHKIEKHLHTEFKDKRVSGEWFNLTENDIEYIKNYNERI